VQAWFSEALVAQFSTLTVYNQERKQVDLQDTRTDPAEPRALVVSLPAGLPDGPYTVVYRVLSEEDGHTIKGGFNFVVGTGPLPPPTGALLGSAEEGNVNLWGISIRWLNYLGMAGLVGGVIFQLFLWRPTASLRRAKLNAAITNADEQVDQRIHALLGWSLGVLLLGWLAFLVYQASTASSSAPWQILQNNALPTLLLKSRFGLLWVIRLVLICLAATLWLKGARLLEARAASEDGAMPPSFYQQDSGWLWLLLGVGMMLTTSLNAHAAAYPPSWLLVPSDVLHLVGMSAWIGGLVALVLALAVTWRFLPAGTGDRTRWLAIIMPRFSLIATISLLLLVITGTVQTIFLLGSFVAFVSNGYGQTLLLKLGVFVLLLALGAYHLLRVSPKMRHFARSTDEQAGASSLGAGRLQRMFQCSLRLEMALAIIILGVVGGLTSMGPPQPTSTSEGRFVKQGAVAGVVYTYVISPMQIGENTFEVALKNTEGKTLGNTELVLSRFLMLDMDMGVQEVELQPLAGRPGYYGTRASVLSMAGSWQITLIVRRTGFDDVRILIPLTLQEP
jgi:copper transport protein